MIDLGLSKLAVIGIVALIVIGPKNLPTTARMLGTLFRRAQRYISQVKAEISQQIELETLRTLQDDLMHTTNTLHDELDQASRLMTLQNTSSTPPLQLSKSINIRKAKKRISTWHCRQTLFIKKNLRQQHLNTRLLSGAARVKRYRQFLISEKNFFRHF